MFNWATSTFDKLSQTMAPPPEDGAARFAYCVQRQDEEGGMGAITSIDPIHSVVSISKGTYPIQLACQYSMPRLIKLLMNQPGANIAIVDLMGNTPLHYAAMSTVVPGALVVCKMLIQEYGASAMSKNSQGKTPYDVCSVNSVRQWLLPFQLQAETQYALDNGGVGLPPGIDMGGLRVKNSNLPPPPTSFGGSPAGGGMPPPGAPQQQQQFGSPPPPAPFGGGPGAAPYSGGHAPYSGGHAPYSGGHAPYSGGPAPYSGGPAPPSPASMFGTPTPPQPHQPQPIAPAPASMPVPSSPHRKYARSGSSSAAIYNRSGSGVLPDGFHSSSSDVNLQKKYGHQPAGYGSGAVVAPPPSSGNSVGLSPSSGGANPFAGGAALGSSNRYGKLPAPARRYVAYGPTNPAPASMSSQPMTTSPYDNTNNNAAAAANVNYSMFAPGGSAVPQQTTSPYAAQTQSNPTSPYMPPPPYQSQNYAADPATPSNNNNSSFGTPDFVSPAGATYGSPATPSASIATPSAMTSPAGFVSTTAPSSQNATGLYLSPPLAVEPSPGVVVVLPEGWTETVDPSSGQSYYYNSNTQETSWERPVLAKVEEATQPATEPEPKVEEEPPKSVEAAPTSDPASGVVLPEGWTEVVDPSSGQSYYYNVNTQETSWERPVAVKVEEATEPELLKVEEPPRKSVEEQVKPEETPAAEGETTLPEEWTETVDPSSGQSYYYNGNTQETSWERPMAAKVEEAAAAPDTEPERKVEGKLEEPPKSEEVEPKPEESGSVTTPAPPSGNATELFTSPPQSSAVVEEPLKAADPSTGALPDGWTETVDPSSGQCYYYNVNTQETLWERPDAETVLSTETAAELDLKVEEPSKSAEAEPKTAEHAVPKDESALPDGWTETMDPSSGQSYYYNAITQETSWEKPQPVIEAAALPEGWSEVMDPSTGRPYFYNSQTQDTSWERPVASASPEEQSQESGASPSDKPATPVNSVENTNGTSPHSAGPASPFAIPQPIVIARQKSAEEMFGEDAPSESPMQHQPFQEPEQSSASPTPKCAMSAGELFGNDEPPAQLQQEPQQPSGFPDLKRAMGAEELFDTDEPPAQEQEPVQSFRIPEPKRAMSADEMFGTDEPPAQEQEPVQSFGIPEPKRAMSADEMFGEEPPADSTPAAEKSAAVESFEPTKGAEKLLADVSLDDTPPGLATPDARPAQNESEPNQEKAADDLDGEEDMLDVPLSPRAGTGGTQSEATNPKPPMATQTAPTGEDNGGDSLFAAIGMPPPPFSSKR